MTLPRLVGHRSLRAVTLTAGGPQPLALPKVESPLLPPHQSPPLSLSPLCVGWISVSINPLVSFYYHYILSDRYYIHSIFCIIHFKQKYILKKTKLHTLLCIVFSGSEEHFRDVRCFFLPVLLIQLISFLLNFGFFTVLIDLR